MSGNAPVKPMLPTEAELALRRAAVLVTSQLPADLAGAMRVLDLARKLVTDFLGAERV